MKTFIHLKSFWFIKKKENTRKNERLSADGVLWSEQTDSDEPEFRRDAQTGGVDPPAFGTLASNSPKTLVRAVGRLSRGINGLNYSIRIGCHGNGSVLETDEKERMNQRINNCDMKEDDETVLLGQQQQRR